MVFLPHRRRRGYWREAAGAGAGGVVGVAGFVGVVDVNDAPTAAFGAEAAGVAVVAVEEFDGVAEVHGEGLGFGVEGLELFALGVGVLLGVGVVAEGAEELAEDGAAFAGAGEGHGDVGGAFGGEALGFAADDVVEGGLDGGVAGEVRDGGVVNTAPVIRAGAGGEGAADDAEVEDLVKVRGEEGGACGDLRKGAGERGLRGECDVHIGGFFDDAVEQAGGVGRVELCKLLGGDGALGGGGSGDVLVPGGEEGADD